MKQLAGMPEVQAFIYFHWPMFKRQSPKAENKQSINDQHAQPYRLINAYTQKPSCQQILTVLLFVALIGLHSVFVTPAATHQQSPILWVLLGLTYLLLIFMTVDYFYLTCTDPVDRLLEQGREGRLRERVRNCLECRHLVRESSYHCHTCNRCVEQFDHHCKFLNNCIGSRNYHSFIRLLLAATLFCITSIAEGIWVFALASSNEQYRTEIISRWGALVSVVISFIMLVAIDSLLCFHCYIVFCLQTTTIKYLWDRESDASNPSRERVDVFKHLQFQVVTHEAQIAQEK